MPLSDKAAVLADLDLDFSGSFFDVPLLPPARLLFSLLLPPPSSSTPLLIIRPQRRPLLHHSLIAELPPPNRVLPLVGVRLVAAPRLVSSPVGRAALRVEARWGWLVGVS